MLHRVVPPRPQRRLRASAAAPRDGSSRCWSARGAGCSPMRCSMICSARGAAQRAAAGGGVRDAAALVPREAVAARVRANGACTRWWGCLGSVLAHKLTRWTARLGRAHPTAQLTVAATIANRLLTVAGRLVKDRVLSTVGPRHGHKSTARRFDGYKGHTAVDPDSELITATAVTPGRRTSSTPPTRTPTPPRAAGCGGVHTVYGPTAAPLLQRSRTQLAAAPGGRFTPLRRPRHRHLPRREPSSEPAATARARRRGLPRVRLRGDCTAPPGAAPCHQRQRGRARRVRARQRDPAWRNELRPKRRRKHLVRRKHGGRHARAQPAGPDPNIAHLGVPPTRHTSDGPSAGHHSTRPDTVTAHSVLSGEPVGGLVPWLGLLFQLSVHDPEVTLSPRRIAQRRASSVGGWGSRGFVVRAPLEAGTNEGRVGPGIFTVSWG